MPTLFFLLRYGVFFFSVSIVTCASVSASTEQQPSAQEIREFAKNPAWLALLHYQTSFGHVVSEVDDAKFFLAVDGKKSPEAELVADINALFVAPVDADMLCRFPARLILLQQHWPHLNWPVQNCPRFIEWQQQVQGDALYLIFPASYINSPSSMFGHTLLRLDKKARDGQTKQPLLSTAINFAAYTDESDNELVYSWKGLTGGYPGYVSAVPYYEKVNTYSHIESRDIWEYKLKLSQAEIDFFIAHIFELNEIRFDYYFIDENCSYRLLTLLDAVNPDWQLATMFSLRTVPSDTLRAVEKKGLFEDINFRPSKTTLIEFKNQHLNENQRDLTARLAQAPDVVATSAEFQAYSAQEQAAMLELAYDYSRYRVLKKKDQNPAWPKRSLRLLSLRAKVPFEGDPYPPVAVPNTRDEQGHKTLRSRILFGADENTSYAEVGWRIAYHDWLDPVPGYREGAQIEMGDVLLHIAEDVRLEQFDVVNIRSAGQRHRFAQPVSWMVQGGYVRSKLDEQGESLLRVGGGYAYGALAGTVYGMGIIQPGLSDRYQDNWRLGYGAELGYLYQSDKSNVWLMADHLASVGTQGASSTLHAGVGYAFNPDHQLQLNVQRDFWRSAAGNSLSVQYAWYH
jgi:hypothetical protein